MLTYADACCAATRWRGGQVVMELLLAVTDDDVRLANILQVGQP
jgi:hypothetical protein